MQIISEMKRMITIFSLTPLFHREESESEVAQSCLTLCDPMDCSLPGYSVHGIFKTRVLERVAFSFSRGSSQPRDWTQASGIVGRHFYCLSHQGSPLWASLVAYLLKKKKKNCLQCGRPGFDPWVGKIPPWRRKRRPTPVFWPGEFHGLYSPRGPKESDTTERLSRSTERKCSAKGFGDLSKVTKLLGAEPRLEPVYCYFHHSKLPWNSLQKRMKTRNSGSLVYLGTP